VAKALDGFGKIDSGDRRYPENGSDILPTGFLVDQGDQGGAIENIISQRSCSVDGLPEMRGVPNSLVAATDWLAA
jgi:hypothetical protein